MTAKQTITFATFQELLPDSCNHPLKKQLRDKARYYGRKFLFKKQCDALVDFLNTHQTWIPLFSTKIHIVLMHCSRPIVTNVFLQPIDSMPLPIIC